MNQSEFLLKLFLSVCSYLMCAPEEELREEKGKMYEAIGYSKNAEVPIYPKEVHAMCNVLFTVWCSGVVS